MKDVIFDSFQDYVNDSLLRHKSILDILTKLQDSESRVNRAVIKSVTVCGCIQINAEKQKMLTETDEFIDLKKCQQTHLSGTLCDNCRQIIESELGNHLFYITSLCNVLDINLYDIMIREYQKIDLLGKYTLR